jgi:uncharacterized protein (UPF0333 family)
MRKMMSRSQVSLEFIILIGMAFIFFFGIVLVLYSITDQKKAQTDYEMFYDLAKSVQTELITVSDAEPGLIVVYELPPAELNYTVDTYKYTLTNTVNSITIDYLDGVITLPTPNINGTLDIGVNTLRNVNGVVYVE